MSLCFSLWSSGPLVPAHTLAACRPSPVATIGCTHHFISRSKELKPLSSAEVTLTHNPCYPLIYPRPYTLALTPPPGYPLADCQAVDVDQILDLVESEGLAFDEESVEQAVKALARCCSNMDEQQLQERIHNNRSFQTLAGQWGKGFHALAFY